MKYMVGYQLRKNADWIEAIIANKQHVYEVYFSWGDMPNGRNSVHKQQGFLPWEAQRQQIDDLDKLSREGLGLNLLLNANCYGEKSLSRQLYEQIGDTVEYIKNKLGLHGITTTSPVIAGFIHSNFPGIPVRASINMDIGSIQGMDYVKDLFDGFYMQREYNRNMERIELIHKWCSDEGKELFLLANSGCLNDCSAHVFHDNLVAHEAQMENMDNAFAFRGICWDYLQNKDKHYSVLCHTSFIRPEDIGRYDKWFTAAKLATRVSRNPVSILEAYVKESHTGNLLDLMEPNHSGALQPMLLENKHIDPQFMDHVLACNKQCHRCNYCKDMFEAALINLTQKEESIQC